MRVYSIFDRKMKEYCNLFIGNTDEATKRAARDSIPQSGSTMAKYPEDFDLMCVAEMDMETGVLRPMEGGARLVENVRDILGAPSFEMGPPVEGFRVEGGA